MPKYFTDPGPEPTKATPQEREAWRQANERFLMEGGRPGVSRVPAEVDPTDRRLKELRRHHSRFLELHSPMKAAIWLALLKPTKEVIHEVEQTRRFRVAQEGGYAGDHLPPDRPAILEIAQTLVAAGIAGDTAAISQIAERIEGKAGLRVGDESEDDPERRRQATDIVERTIKRLTQARVEEKIPGDGAKVVDAVVEPVRKGAK